MTRPAPRTYRSQVSVEKVTEHLFIIRSVPYPIHAAEVFPAWVRTDTGRKLNGWLLRMLTGQTPAYRVPMGLERTLSDAAELVGLLAGHELKNRFHGVQRTAMGQGRCPYLDRRLCLGVSTPGSVWCEKHPSGRKLVE